MKKKITVIETVSKELIGVEIAKYLLNKGVPKVKNEKDQGVNNE